MLKYFLILSELLLDILFLFNSAVTRSSDSMTYLVTRLQVDLKWDLIPGRESDFCILHSIPTLAMVPAYSPIQ